MTRPTLSIQARTERRIAIADAIRGGQEPEAVASALGVCLQTIRIACRVYGVRLPPKLNVRRCSDRTFAILAKLINTDTKHSAIAFEHGVSPSRVAQVSRMAREVGIRLWSDHRGTETTNQPNSP